MFRFKQRFKITFVTLYYIKKKIFFFEYHADIINFILILDIVIINTLHVIGEKQLKNELARTCTSIGYMHIRLPNLLHSQSTTLLMCSYFLYLCIFLFDYMVIPLIRPFQLREISLTPQGLGRFILLYIQ